MKKLLLISFFSLFFLTWCSSIKEINNSSIKEINKPTLSDTRKWLSLNENWNIINCELSLSTYITAKPDNNNKYNKIESNNSRQEYPLKLTFVWLNTKEPIMKWNTDTVPLMKIDNWDTIYLIETTSIGNIAIYTYFPKEKTIIMSKQYNIVGTLYAGQMMGFCE